MVTKEVRNMMAQKRQPGDSNGLNLQNPVSAEPAFKRPLALPIDLNAAQMPSSSHLYPTQTMAATVYGMNQHANIFINQMELLQQQMQLRSHQLASTGLPINDGGLIFNNPVAAAIYPPQTLRRPLVERISPNDNRFSPYSRPTARVQQSMWDYSPISSKPSVSGPPILKKKIIIMYYCYECNFS